MRGKWREEGEEWWEGGRENTLPDNLGQAGYPHEERNDKSSCLATACSHSMKLPVSLGEDCENG